MMDAGELHDERLVDLSAADVGRSRSNARHGKVRLHDCRGGSACRSRARRCSSPAPRAASGLRSRCEAARDGANIAIAAKTETPHPKLEGTIHTAAAGDREGRRQGAAAGGRRARRGRGQGRASTRPRHTSAASTSWSTTPAPSQLTPVAETDMKRFDLMQQINTRGTFMVSKYAIPHLEKAANPHILMLSPPLDMKEKWFAGSHRLFDGEIRHEPGGARPRRRTARQGSRSTRCGRAPRSPPRRSRTCSAATR